MQSKMHEETYDTAKEDERYYDTLYNFANVAIKANDMAMDGYSTNQIAKRLQKSAEAFFLLCKMDKVEVKKKDEKKKAPDQIEEKPQEEAQTTPVQQDPEPLPDNFIREENGWGLCPMCRKKMLKLTSTTKLINFPAYCKECRTDYMVSWWNVDNKDIAYTRYVNNKRYINREDIRSYAMRGTGLGSFLNTNTSATERVAMEL